jgi:hypothetical protein
LEELHKERQVNERKEQSEKMTTTNFDTTLRRRMGMEKVNAGFTQLGFHLP